MRGEERRAEESRGEDRTGQDRTGQDRTGQDRGGRGKREARRDSVERIMGEPNWGIMWVNAKRRKSQDDCKMAIYKFSHPAYSKLING